MLPGIDDVGTGCEVGCFPFACSVAVADAAGCDCGTINHYLNYYY